MFKLASWMVLLGAVAIAIVACDSREEEIAGLKGQIADKDAAD